MAELVDIKPRMSAASLGVTSEKSDKAKAENGGESSLAWPLHYYVGEDVNATEKGLMDAKPGNSSHGGGAKHHGHQRFLENAVVTQRRNVIIKNVIVVCVVFLLSHIALFGTFDLRRYSRLDGSAPSRLLDLCETVTLLAFTLLGLLFLAPVIVVKFGVKVSMAVGLASGVLYVLAHMYTHWATLIPGAIVLGLGGGCMWSALGVYLTEAGQSLTVLSSSSTNRAVNMLFGCFYLVFTSTFVWDALTSAFVTQKSAETATLAPPTVNTCGAFHFPAKINENFTGQTIPDTVKLYTLRGTYLLLATLALLALCLCLSKNRSAKYDTMQRQRTTTTHNARGSDSVKGEIAGEASVAQTSCRDVLLWATLYQAVRRHQVLLTPITVYSGLQLVFFFSDITQSYVACSSGPWMVAMTTVCWGAVSAMFAAIFGRLVTLTGRIPLFVCGGLIQCGVLLTLFLWRPGSDSTALFFVISGLWGVCDAVWRALLSSMYASVFAHGRLEAAFSCFHVWRLVGVGAAFTYGLYVSSYVKIFTLLSVLSLGIMGYFAVEVPIYRRERS